MRNNSIKQPFLGYVNIIRGVAIVLIVASHIFYGLTDNNVIIGFLNATVRNSTVIFLFISGFLFQYLSQDFVLLKYYRRKFKYVVLPYLVFSVIIISGRLYEQFSNADFTSIPGQVVEYLLTGSHLLPYWYIPVIVLFFISGPVWILIDRHPQLYWFLPLMVIVSILVPRDSLGNILKMFVHFMSVYLTGMFFSHYRQRIYKISDRNKILFTTILIVITVVAYLPEQLSFQYWWLQYLKNMCWCWGLFFWFQKWDFHKNRILDTLAEYSFGLYFIHFIFCVAYRKVLELFIPYSYDKSTFVWFIVFVVGLIVVIAGSYCTLYVFKRVLKSKARMLIGV